MGFLTKLNLGTTTGWGATIGRALQIPLFAFQFICLYTLPRYTLGRGRGNEESIVTCIDIYL